MKYGQFGFGRKRTRAQALIECGARGLFAGDGFGDDDEGGDKGGAGGAADKEGNGGTGDKGGDGEFAKRLEALEAENARLKSHADDILSQRKKDRDRADELARKAGDWEALEASYKEKLAENENSVASLTAIIENNYSGKAASDIAAEVAVKGSEELVRRWVAPRIRTEFRGPGQEPKVTVLDKAGKPSAMTLAELKQELLTEKALAPVLVDSRANGAGGANPDAGGTPGSTMSKDEWSKLNGKQKAAAMKTNPNLKLI